MKTLTYDDIGNLHDKRVNGRKARTLSLDYVYKWACKQPDIIINKDTSLSLRMGEPNDINN